MSNAGNHVSDWALLIVISAILSLIFAAISVLMDIVERWASVREAQQHTDDVLNSMLPVVRTLSSVCSATKKGI